MCSMQDAINANKESVEASKKKPLKKSLTVKASAANSILPIIAFLVSRHLGVEAELAATIAAGIFSVLSFLTNYGMRRALGSVLIILSLSVSTACETVETRMDKKYVTADQKTLDAVGPRLDSFEAKHGSNLEKKLWAELKASWQSRIDEEKKSWK